MVKTRVGEEVSLTGTLYYTDENGQQQSLVSELPAGSLVLIADDFTNSGDTLFKCAAVVRRCAGPGVIVRAFVTHFVAKYSRDMVEKFADRLYAGELDSFACTDSIPALHAGCAKRCLPVTLPRRASM